MNGSLHDPQNSRVVLIGAHTFDRLDPLPAVARNLSRLRELLTDPQVWGLPPQNCVTIEQPASQTQVLDALHDAASAATDLLLLYYAGHGLVSMDNEDLLLSLPDCRPDRGYTSLPFQSVRNVLRGARRVPAKAVLLDCCFAGRALDGAMGPAEAQLAELSRVEGTYVLTASSATRQASAPPGETYTAFTGHLIDVLEHGIADGPALLDLATVHDHLHRVLPALGHPEPHQRNDDHGARIVLGHNRHASAATLPAVLQLPSDLREFLRAQRDAARNFTYRLYEAPVDGLATVYVRQQARSAPPAKAEPREEFDPGDPRRRHFVPDEVARSPAPPRAVEDALASHRHLVITGGAGHGKSTLSLQLAATLATEFGTSTDPAATRLLPLRVIATRLAADRSALVPRLIRILSEELAPQLDQPLPEDLLDRLPEGTTCLLIVDGLDEITDPDRRRALISELAGRTQNPDSRFRLLVTTRPLPNDELTPLTHAATGTYTLEPFDRDQLREFAHRWFRDRVDGPALTEGFLRQAEAAGVRDLVRVPLLATVAALVYQKAPATPLPSSRFTLYTDYFTLLADARLEEVHRQQQTILQRWALRPSAQRNSAAFLFEHRAELVEHLAVTAVTTTGSAAQGLLDIALDWLDDNGCRTTRRNVPEWQKLVGSVLETVGVFTHHRDFLRFTHYSFAEHIAANVRAEQLPAHFDPEHPAWARTLHQALNDDLFAHAVLAHHAHLQGNGDALLEWLDGGTGAYGTLLALGIPASDVHVQSFVARLLRTLAADSTGSPVERACRDAAALIQQPTVHQALTTYMDKLYRSVEQRLQIAEALMVHAPNAVLGTLRDVMAAPDVWAMSRTKAAVRLAELGPAHIIEAAETIRAVLAAPDTKASELLYAAEALAGLGPEYTAGATDILRDRPVPRSFHDRRDHAQALAALDPANSREAASALRDLLTTFRIDSTRRSFITQAIAELGPEYVAEAAELCRANVTAPDTDTDDHVWIAEELAGLGPEYVVEAADFLRGSLTASDTRPYVRTNAARALAELGREFLAEAARGLRTNLTGSDAGERNRIAGVLADLGPEHVTEAAGIVRANVAGAEIDPSERRSAARVLAGFGPEYVEEAANILRAEVTAPDVPIRSRITAAGELAELGPGHITAAAEALRANLAAPDCTAIERDHAARLIAELGPEYGLEAADIHRANLAMPDISAHVRTDTAGHLANLGSPFIPEAASILRADLMAPSCDTGRYIRAAAGLARLGPSYIAEAARAIRTKLESPHIDANDRIQMARMLAETGPEYVEPAVRVLRTQLTAVDSDARERGYAADVYADISADHTPELTTALRAILAAPESTIPERTIAARTLAHLHPERTAEAVHTLHADILAVGCAVRDRTEAAEVLAECSPSHVPELADVHRATLTAREVSVADRTEAARALANLGNRYRAEAAEALRGLLDEPDISCADRASAAVLLMPLDHLRVAEATGVIRAVIADPDCAANARVEAAYMLARLEPAYRREAAEALRAILAAADTEDLARVDAAAMLAALGWSAEAADVLRDMGTSATLTARARNAAARALGCLGQGYVADAAAMLRATLTSPDSRAADRNGAARALAELGLGFTAEATEAFRSLLTSPSAAPHDRITAARSIVELGPDFRSEAAEVIRAVLADPAGSMHTRTRAARALAELGPRYLDEAAGRLGELMTSPAASPLATRRAAAALGRLSPRFRVEAAEVLGGRPSAKSPSTYGRRARVRVLYGLGHGYVL
ncbi:caspase, EACC1-associated type [Embleya sp. NBC_00896]|uniref:caspase, EACC1-associated type n=1 Tax=Embleya sp. NBC_00896 TaxID=2975961 RepID=UPI002F91AA71|nr:caspase family protein [Embleya sp. NBC_00896]